MVEGDVVLEFDADTDGAEDVIDEVTMAVEGLADALEDVDSALRRIDAREFSISIELQARPAAETGDSNTETEQ